MLIYDNIIYDTMPEGPEVRIFAKFLKKYMKSK